MLYQIKNIYNTVELIRYPHEFREGGGGDQFIRDTKKIKLLYSK